MPTPPIILNAPVNVSVEFVVDVIDMSLMVDVLQYKSFVLWASSFTKILLLIPTPPERITEPDEVDELSYVDVNFTDKWIVCCPLIYNNIQYK